MWCPPMIWNKNRTFVPVLVLEGKGGGRWGEGESQMPRSALFQFLPPANVVCEGYVFTPVCDSVNRGGMRGCSLLGGHAWFYLGGHAWFYSGGMHGFI